ncbi:nucleotidyltransferase family protein [Porphyrobacter sp. AAP60]|uniref:nucleotidyltransferase family protein n=1 Tax=Porphyrobacter sp. AAP60 TaxID=1523423 RepID=UPI0009E7C146
MILLSHLESRPSLELTARVDYTFPLTRRLADALRPALALPGYSRPDPETIALAVARHRVAPLLHYARSLTDDTLDPVQVGRLEELKRINLRRSMRQKAAASQLSARLRTLGIAAVVVKGSKLGEILYGEEGRRHSKDVDILVEASAMVEVLNMVAAYGYRTKQRDAVNPEHAMRILRYHHEVSVIDPRLSVEIELHSRLLSRPPSGWSDACFFSAPLDLQSPEYVLYLLLHGARSNWMRLNWLCDLVRIAQLTPRDVRATVIDMADAYDCSSALLASFHLAHAIWPEDFAEAWIDGLAPKSERTRAERHLRVFLRELLRESPRSPFERLARRVEMVRDIPLCGTSYPPRLRAVWDQNALWWLRKNH